MCCKIKGADQLGSCCTAHLLCIYAKSRFSHDVVHIILPVTKTPISLQRGRTDLDLPTAQVKCIFDFQKRKGASLMIFDDN